MVRTLIAKQRVVDATLDGDPGQDLFDWDLAADLIEASAAEERAP